MSGKKGKVHYSGEMKEQVRKEIGAGKSQREVSRKYGISRYAIHSWCGLRPETKLRQIAPLPKGRPRKIRTLEDYQKENKCCGIFSRSQKGCEAEVQIPSHLSSPSRVSRICYVPVLWRIRKRGYHDYIKRLGQAHKDAALAEKLRVQQAHCFQTYGYRRMHLWLESQGIHFGEKAVHFQFVR